MIVYSMIFFNHSKTTILVSNVFNGQETNGGTVFNMFFLIHTSITTCLLIWVTENLSWTFFCIDNITPDVKLLSIQVWQAIHMPFRVFWYTQLKSKAVQELIMVGKVSLSQVYGYFGLSCCSLRKSPLNQNLFLWMTCF